MTTQASKSSLVRWLLGILLVVYFVSVLYSGFFSSHPEIHSPSCRNHLKQLGYYARFHSQDDENAYFPPLSRESGRLFFSTDSLIDRNFFDPTFFVCPLDEDANRILGEMPDENANGEPVPGFDLLADDWSYFYTGYALLSDEDVEAFAAYYRANVDDPDAFVDDIELGGEARQVHIESYGSDLLAAIYRKLLRLRDGVEQEFFTNVSKNQAALAATVQSSIPILIERPDNHEGNGKHPGANVLYLDGHVEYIPYPGKWPMTERTIGLLLELDALGAK